MKRVFSSDASCTIEMLERSTISLCPRAAAAACSISTAPSATAVTNCEETPALRASSDVVEFCSTAAAATAPNTGCTFSIMPTILLTAAISSAASCWSLPMRPAISSVAFWVSTDSALTSSATTAKPRPAAPARAASILALSASRLVCLAIAAITLTTLPISPDDCLRPSRLCPAALAT